MSVSNLDDLFLSFFFFLLYWLFSEPAYAIIWCMRQIFERKTFFFFVKYKNNDFVYVEIRVIFISKEASYTRLRKRKAFHVKIA